MVATIFGGQLPVLLDRANEIVARHGRAMLGITGAPGSGKSTLAEALVSGFEGRAVLVPMDGFHLAQCELERLGRTERKGAIDTFDVDGFLNFLLRLRAGQNHIIYAPYFRRDLEEPVGSAIPIPPDAELIVVEGNYLLAEEGDWAGVREVLDAVWFVAPVDSVRIERLIRRHVQFGRTPAEARAWTLGTDEVNARQIQATRHLADLVVTE